MMSRVTGLLRRPALPRSSAPSFRADAGGERVIAVNRLLGGLLAFGFVLTVSSPQGTALALTWSIGSGFVAVSIVLLLVVTLRPRPSAVRRLTAMLIDTVGISVALHVGGAAAALIYPAYLWMIFGNGFRFGVLYIVVSTILALAGFSLVVATTPFWRTDPSLTAGLLLALIILPSYAFVLTRRLDAARREAEEASRAKTLFLASVSHELRTPLNAIVGMGDLLRASRLDAEQAQMVTTIETAAETLLSLIKDLLDFSRTEAGRLHITPSDFNLGGLLAAVQSMMEPQARAKGLVLNTFITARSELMLHGDQRYLREILLNLCGNAVKFTDRGSVTIAADGELTGDDTVRLRLEVTDTGIGIAQEAQARIFELFTQADASVMDRYGGTGLGLTLVDKLVRGLGGQVGVRSAPGHGSTFWVCLDVGRSDAEPGPMLPVRVAAVSADVGTAEALAAAARQLGADACVLPNLDAKPAGPAIILLDASAVTPVGQFPDQAIVRVRPVLDAGLPPREICERFATAIRRDAPIAELARALQIAATRLPAPAAQTALATQTAGIPLHVLVADDNRINQTVMQRILERAGHSVTLVSDGEQALQMLLNGGIDVALMDVNMPALNGIDAAQTYQFGVLGTQRIPIIGLTADASVHTARRCLDAGMAACLTKPIRTPELLGAIEEVRVDAARSGAASTPDPVVTAIAAHPRFRAAPPLSIEPQAVADLLALGGQDFVRQVVNEFMTDAEAIIAGLEAAASARDVHRFRADAHALCSCSANLGAAALRTLCEPWQYITAAELEGSGPELVERLREVWQRTGSALHSATRPGQLGTAKLVNTPQSYH